MRTFAILAAALWALAATAVAQAAPGTAVIFFSATPASAVTLDVQPAVALADKPLSIVVRRLHRGERVTLTGTLRKGKTTWRSSADFDADAQGTIDTSRRAPIAGDYRGIDRMGLIWSMGPVKQAASASADDGDLASSIIDVSVRTNKERQPIAERSVLRLAVRDGVRRTAVSGNGWGGVLYRPAGSARVPVVIVLGGAEGGRYDAQAALLASYGYAALALAYFGVPGLPRQLSNIPLETIKSGIDWLVSRPGVLSGRVGLIGTSKGGELALLAASKFPEVAVVIGYSAPTFVGFGLAFGANGKQSAPTSSWTFRGQPLPFVPQSAIGVRADGGAIADFDKAPAAAAIPVEAIRGPVLLIAGADDGLDYAGPYAQRALQRLRAHHHPYQDQVLIYPLAGHLIDAPYHPTTQEHDALTPYGKLVFGGTAAGNAHADADSWPRVLTLLHTTLIEKNATPRR